MEIKEEPVLPVTSGEATAALKILQQYVDDNTGIQPSSILSDVNKSYEHCQNSLDAISDYSDSDEEIGEEMQQVAVPDAEVVPANRPVS
uniref:Uncharacterized protein n=1 Tax=Ditylenchus dipsaci TaxID=166011 RepID=A0A915EH35_9BILA